MNKKLIFRKFTETLDRITLLDAFEKVLFFLACAAFWGIAVGAFLLVNSPNPRHESLLIGCSVGVIAIYIGYHRQKEKDRIDLFEKEIKR